MNFYESELKALQRAGRYRERHVSLSELKDFSSNDYLGLAHNKTLHEAATAKLSTLDAHATKASMLVSGYHQIHKDFEDALCKANGFESGVVLGSGFNANIALIEALVRNGDTLFMDELYHASGILASQIGNMDVIYFKHNDMQELRELLRKSEAKRKIIAVEGIYSMDGDMCSGEVFAIADEAEAILIVDEAHSSGVVGENLMGVFDYYNVAIGPNHIKMGTLGKAYGSFGAFILASSHIIDYLINRAKPIIYATSLSLYDTLLGHFALEYILQNKENLKKEIALRKSVVYDELGISMSGLIAAIAVGNNIKVMQIKEALEQKGFSVGAIRQPTVSSAIIRLIARVSEDIKSLEELCKAVAVIR